MKLCQFGAWGNILKTFKINRLDYLCVKQVSSHDINAYNQCKGAYIIIHVLNTVRDTLLFNQSPNYLILIAEQFISPIFLFCLSV